VRHPRQSCPDRVSEVYFRCFEWRTVHATVADCLQFIFQQCTESTPDTVLRLDLPPDSPPVSCGQFAVVFLARIRTFPSQCVFGTLAGGQSDPSLGQSGSSAANSPPPQSGQSGSAQKVMFSLVALGVCFYHVSGVL
jgi:hypothetical protein